MGYCMVVTIIWKKWCAVKKKMCKKHFVPVYR